jgi:hypothetical protein
MAEIIDGSVMAEAVGVTSIGYLGGPEVLRSLEVVVYPVEQRAVVWAGLRDTSLDSQLAAVAAFADVRDCYADELEVELRFGEPGEPTSERATVKTMELTH